MDLTSKQQEFDNLVKRVQQLEAEIAEGKLEERWQPKGHYAAYEATSGFVLGVFGAAAALMVNVICAPIAGKPSLELIRIFLTFPLGEQALKLQSQAGGGYAVSDGMILAFGCCLYLFTGMLLGIPMYIGLSRMAGKSGVFGRMIVGAILGLVLWGINFYGILSWLQPALFQGSWILDSSLLPWWVAAGTHVVYGVTMGLLYPFGQFLPLAQANSKS